MSDRRLRRFLHLERPRRPDSSGQDPDPPRPGGGRFDGVERPRPAPSPAAPAPAAPRTGAQLDRFGPEPEPVIELVDTEGKRPFTRCMRCGGDSNIFATECGGCGMSLDTPAQHEFNERLWAERQAESEREAGAATERRELAARAEKEDARARRALAEAMAREVGDRERRRIGVEEGGWGGGLGWGRDSRPLGLRLLALIPDRRWQIAAAAAAAALVLGLVARGLAGMAHGHRGPWFPLGVGLLALLALPAGWWRWRR